MAASLKGVRQLSLHVDFRDVNAVIGEDFFPGVSSEQSLDHLRVKYRATTSTLGRRPDKLRDVGDSLAEQVAQARGGLAEENRDRGLARN
ncbi:MAG TPA: hypothetical protein VJ820_00275 [Propionibacteriaceae bacterium]|nr:hypothetical protein [Propionibacteriaceae bacterium]